MDGCDDDGDNDDDNGSGGGVCDAMKEVMIERGPKAW